MPIIDTAELATGASPTGLESDVLVIGSGPAGGTIARELAKAGRTVTVLESGGREREPAADELNRIESVGRPRAADQWDVRNRVLGGASHTWGGRCAPFDPIDLQQRDWVPYSGWPFTIQDLAPYFDRTAEYLGLEAGNGFTGDGVWGLIGHKPPKTRLDESALLPMFWQFSRDSANPYDKMRFGRTLVENLGDRITLVTHATVVRIDAGESGSAVRGVEFAGADGRTWSLRAATVVLAAGGIENPRLLLASGLGNGFVGRFLMDHVRGPVGRFRPDEAYVLTRRFGTLRSRGKLGNLYIAGFKLSPELQRREGLLNCAGWVNEQLSEHDPWDALKSILLRQGDLRHNLGMIASHLPLFAKGLRDYFIRRQALPRIVDGITVDAITEQRPDPESRVTLSDQRDRFGVPLARVDWHIAEDELRTMRRLGGLVVEQFPRMGLPAPTLEPWIRDDGDLPPSYVDVAHPTATTRMSPDGSAGVVDSTGEVHGVEGLFVAGSSVFPTAGHANPTEMILAMSLRLADTLATRSRASIGAAAA